MQRLKTRPQFQATLAGGIVARTPHFALHRLALAPVTAHARQGAGVAAPHGTGAASDAGPPPSAGAPHVARPLFFPPGHAWLGAMVPKRWARRAVTRNAIKRQIYTLGGELAPCFARDVAYVVRLRSGFDRVHFVSATSDALKRAVRAELRQLLGRLVRPGGSAGTPAASVASVAPAASTPAP